MNPKRILVLSVLAIVLAACGASDPKVCIREGDRALGSSDYKAAKARYSEALKELKPSDPQYVDAKLGLVEAEIPDDPKLATEEFLALAKQFPDRVGEKEFINVASHMVSAKKHLDAIDLLHAGFQRFGAESPQLVVQMERVKKEGASNSAVNDKLKGLGYVK